MLGQPPVLDPTLADSFVFTAAAAPKEGPHSFAALSAFCSSCNTARLATARTRRFFEFGRFLPSLLLLPTPARVPPPSRGEALPSSGAYIEEQMHLFAKKTL